mmetsp:Transcript_29026/g.69750  ORF Transcript_29026/g.69750 Transcript_29026/m.69750 type:complete len:338 (-) Transcript_29026:90-1103(-)
MAANVEMTPFTLPPAVQGGTVMAATPPESEVRVEGDPPPTTDTVIALAAPPNPVSVTVNPAPPCTPTSHTLHAALTPADWYAKYPPESRAVAFLSVPTDTNTAPAEATAGVVTSRIVEERSDTITVTVPAAPPPNQTEGAGDEGGSPVTVILTTSPPAEDPRRGERLETMTGTAVTVRLKDAVACAIVKPDGATLGATAPLSIPGDRYLAVVIRSTAVEPPTDSTSNLAAPPPATSVRPDRDSDTSSAVANEEGGSEMVASSVHGVSVSHSPCVSADDTVGSATYVRYACCGPPRHEMDTVALPALVADGGTTIETSDGSDDETCGVRSDTVADPNM